ncbi:MAG: hypothetical protein ABSE86_11930 [Bryobacteraceae bacterium]
MAQKRLATVVDALKKHGLKDEEVASLQTKLDPLLLEEGEVHVHIEGDDTHIHVDLHDFE